MFDSGDYLMKHQTKPSRKHPIPCLSVYNSKN